ncbi:aminoglycoside phosphotransferase family protein [Streptomyces sp. NPDC002790]|uniref:phosphotransferase family protein n=1 Tax=Streptomyces sp. NPDC002790 TaxID=3154431 RepID=UPI00331F3170
MDFRPVRRAPGAFQQSLVPDDFTAVCHRAFGPSSSPLSAVELGLGMYNNTYKIELAGHNRPVILRVAPEPTRQFRSEQHLMRNEYASVPWLAVIAPLMPRVIAADWSHEIVRRDWMIQSCLDGVPAPDRLGAYPREAWPTFYRQMGAITRSVHDVRGPRFGPVGSTGHATWSEAVITSLEEIATDLESLALESSDIRKVAALAGHSHTILDEVTDPRLLTGDLWTVNALLDPSASEPTITGVLDFDRTWFGDPAADWTIRMARSKSDERQAFFEPYGALDDTPAAQWRALVYEARHLGALRLERHRLGKTDAVRESFDAVAKVLDGLS